MERRRIAILFGGNSPEYGVSLESASSVIENLDTEKFEPVLIGISRGGEWFRFTGDTGKIADDTWRNPRDCVRAVISPDRRSHGFLEFREESLRTVRLDAAMPVLHGKNGEDGTVQGLLELAGIPVAGCGVLSSALCMDKARAHALAGLQGVRVPHSFVIHETGDLDFAEECADKLGYPLFVKPVRAGSSFGITRVSNRASLPSAIRQAFTYDDEVILEENIPGFEVGCAVLGSRELFTGEIDEIELQDGFFDYTEKYSLVTSKIHVPARISPEKAEELKTTAKVIYRALGCAGFARVDMFLTPGGQIVFNEVNTIPGFTSHSRYPSMMRAAGLSFTEVLTAIIEGAIKAAVIHGLQAAVSRGAVWSAVTKGGMRT